MNDETIIDAKVLKYINNNLLKNNINNIIKLLKPFKDDVLRKFGIYTIKIFNGGVNLQFLYKLDKEKFINHTFVCKNSIIDEQYPPALFEGQYYIKRYNTIFIVDVSKEPLKDSFINVYIFGKHAKYYYDKYKNFKPKLNYDCICYHNIFKRKDSIMCKTNAVNKRSFDSVFINKNIKSTLLNSIDSWVKMKDIYKKHGIKYKYNILLYGDFGTGKSTIAKAIASYLNISYCKLYQSDISNSLNIVSEDLPNDENILLLVEDVDKIFDKNNLKGNEQNYNDFMQFLDGSLSVDNSITIMTTNHPELLSDELLRDGRVDLRLEIGKLDRDCAIDMIKSFDIDESFIDNIELPINPSKLQNILFKEIAVKNGIRMEN